MKPGEFRVVNHSVPREDGLAKVTGRAVFTSDIRLDGMAYAKLLRSPVAHARILSVTSGQNGDYTRLAQDFTGIDRENARVSDRASQQLRIGHAVQPDVARKDSPARDLGHAVSARNRMIDDAELPVLHANLSLVWIWKLR